MMKIYYCEVAYTVETKDDDVECVNAKFFCAAESYEQAAAFCLKRFVNVNAMKLQEWFDEIIEVDDDLAKKVFDSIGYPKEF